MEQIVALFTTLLGYAVQLAAVVAACYVAVGGFLYLTAGGSPRQAEAGITAIKTALAGLIVVLLASQIAGLVQNAVAAG